MHLNYTQVYFILHLNHYPVFEGLEDPEGSPMTKWGQKQEHLMNRQHPRIKETKPTTSLARVHMRTISRIDDVQFNINLAKEQSREDMLGKDGKSFGFNSHTLIVQKQNKQNSALMCTLVCTKSKNKHSELKMDWINHLGSPWEVVCNFLDCGVSWGIAFNVVLEVAPSTSDENLKLMALFSASVLRRDKKKKQALYFTACLPSTPVLSFKHPLWRYSLIKQDGVSTTIYMHRGHAWYHFRIWMSDTNNMRRIYNVNSASNQSVDNLRTVALIM